MEIINLGDQFVPYIILVGDTDTFSECRHEPTKRDASRLVLYSPGQISRTS